MITHSDRLTLAIFTCAILASGANSVAIRLSNQELDPLAPPNNSVL